MSIIHSMQGTLEYNSQLYLVTDYRKSCCITKVPICDWMTHQMTRLLKADISNEIFKKGHGTMISLLSLLCRAKLVNEIAQWGIIVIFVL